MKDTQGKDLRRFLTDANFDPELTFSKKFLVLWNNNGRDDGGQVINPNLMTPDKSMGKQHKEMNCIILSISNQIETAPALLTELGTTPTIVSLANNSPCSIHTGIPRDIKLSKFSKPCNTVAKLQKTIADSYSPRKEVNELPKPLQLVSALLLRKFAVPQKKVTEYREQAYSPQITITETPKLACSTKFANRLLNLLETTSI